jgi:hypothetical protein
LKTDDCRLKIDGLTTAYCRLGRSGAATDRPIVNRQSTIRLIFSLQSAIYNG